MTGTAILQARGLRREFSKRRMFGMGPVVKAVDGVDLSIEEGETFAIVGESGCGKSTLARLLVRLIEPTAGDVHFDGIDIGKMTAADTRALRAKMQFVFQDPFSSLNPRMTVGALVEEPLKIHDIGTPQTRQDAVVRMLARVGLRPEHRDRYPHEFSGGQRQRIGIARALVTEPRIVIGDEPVSALDVSIQAQIVNILADLKAEMGLTLIVIAHDLAVVRHMADRVAVMYLGRIVEVGRAAELFADPRHPYTEALLSAIPLPSTQARRAAVKVEGDPPDPISPPPGCPFHPRCTYATDLCRTEVPILKDGTPGRQDACHHAGTLDLQGLRGEGGVRSDAAQRRFDLYKKAVASRWPEPTKPLQQRG